jgi:hypothetical protein
LIKVKISAIPAKDIFFDFTDALKQKNKICKIGQDKQDFYAFSSKKENLAYLARLNSSWIDGIADLNKEKDSEIMTNAAR